MCLAVACARVLCVLANYLYSAQTHTTLRTTDNERGKVVCRRAAVQKHATVNYRRGCEGGKHK